MKNKNDDLKKSFLSKYEKFRSSNDNLSVWIIKNKIGDLIVRVGIKLNKTGSFLVKKYKNVDEELNV